MRLYRRKVLEIRMQSVGYHDVNKLVRDVCLGMNGCQEGGGGGGGGNACRLGLKMSTIMRPNIISSRRKMHFLLPVFF